MQFEILGGRYQLQDPTGRGGMSGIYRALDLQTDRVVAIKVLRGITGMGKEANINFVRRFQREAKAILELQHPNIVQVYDYGYVRTDGKCYIVMEFVEGTDLLRKIARVRTLTVLPRLDKERKRSVVQFLHESGLIKRDKRIVDLRVADLSEACLYVADLSGTSLWIARLSEANLSEVNLYRADLRYADLSGANLYEADLSYANLIGANVSPEQWNKAKSLQGATMPDGSIHA